jgi:hypothetical protein
MPDKLALLRQRMLRRRRSLLPDGGSHIRRAADLFHAHRQPTHLPAGLRTGVRERSKSEEEHRAN